MNAKVSRFVGFGWANNTITSAGAVSVYIGRNYQTLLPAKTFHSFNTYTLAQTQTQTKTCPQKRAYRLTQKPQEMAERITDRLLVYSACVNVK